MAKSPLEELNTTKISTEEALKSTENALEKALAESLTLGKQNLNIEDLTDDQKETLVKETEQRLEEKKVGLEDKNVRLAFAERAQKIIAEQTVKMEVLGKKKKRTADEDALVEEWNKDSIATAKKLITLEFEKEKAKLEAKKRVALVKKLEKDYADDMTAFGVIEEERAKLKPLSAEELKAQARQKEIEAIKQEANKLALRIADREKRAKKISEEIAELEQKLAEEKKAALGSLIGSVVTAKNTGTESSEEIPDALKDVASTEEALHAGEVSDKTDAILALTKLAGLAKFDEKLIAEAYHKAKTDGSNPELVTAVENIFGKTTPPEEKEVATESEEAKDDETPEPTHLGEKEEKEIVTTFYSEPATSEREKNKIKASEKALEELKGKRNIHDLTHPQNWVGRNTYTTRRLNEKIGEIESDKKYEESEFAYLKALEEWKLSTPDKQKEIFQNLKTEREKLLQELEALEKKSKSFIEKVYPFSAGKIRGKERRLEEVERLIDRTNGENPLKWFTLEKLDPRIRRNIGWKHMTDEDYTDIDTRYFPSITDRTHNAVWCTANGFIMRLQNKDELPRDEKGRMMVRDEKALYTIVGPDGIIITKDIGAAEGKERMLEEAKKYQEQVTAEYNKLHK